MTDSHTDLIARVGGQVIDFDNHYYEPDDCWSRHIDPKYRDLAIVPQGPPGMRVWGMHDRAVRAAPPGMYTDVIMPPGFAAKVFSGKGDFDFGDLVALDSQSQSLPALLKAEHPEFVERDARLKVMDVQNVRSVIMLPTGGLICYYDFIDRVDALCANYTSFNRWVEEEWSFGGTDQRIFGVPILHLLDLNWAIGELERVADRGSRFVWLPHSPVNDKSPADPSFDPFWARIEETGIKPIFHISEEGFYVDNYCAHWGENTQRHYGQLSALQFFMCLGDRPISDSFASIILHNLFGRFPGIEIISIENGSSWIGQLFQQMDKAAKLGRIGEWLGGPLQESPSEIFRQHVYINPFHEDDVVSLIDTIGVDRILFGSDWPHPEGIKEPLDYLPMVVDQIPDADAQKIMHDNAAGLLGV